MKRFLRWLVPDHALDTLGPARRELQRHDLVLGTVGERGAERVRLPRKVRIIRPRRRW